MRLLAVKEFKQIRRFGPPVEHTLVNAIITYVITINVFDVSAPNVPPLDDLLLNTALNFPLPDIPPLNLTLNVPSLNVLQPDDPTAQPNTQRSITKGPTTQRANNIHTVCQAKTFQSFCLHCLQYLKQLANCLC